MAQPPPLKEEAEAPPWQWISPAEFKPPSASIQTTFRTRAGYLLKSIRFWKKTKEAPPVFVSREKLASFSKEELDRIAPPIDGKVYSESLTPVLASWCDAPVARFVAVLDIPHSGTARILKEWAIGQGLNILEPPDPSELLKFSESGDSWLDRLTDLPGPWVLPDLDQCWLRHEAGLGRVRRFYERLTAGRLGYGIIGCGSWAWAFFRHALGFSAPFAVVVNPMDAARLGRWFGELAKHKHFRPIQCRQSDTGRFILSSASGSAAEEDKTASPNPYLRDLAAFSHGIPGVAHAYWRKSLQAGPDTLDLDDAGEKTGGSLSTIWVKPWSQVEKPALPGKAGRLHGFVLHSLLLHGRMNIDTLSMLVPPGGFFGQALQDLSDAALIVEEDDHWRVSAAGYPVARSFLKSEGFLTDDFI